MALIVEMARALAPACELRAARRALWPSATIAPPLVETVCFDMGWSLVKEGREAGCHSGKAKPHDVRLKPWSESRKRRSGIEGQAAWRLYVANQFSLSAGVSVYVAL